MTDLVFRTATRDDLPAMIAMIADDQLGQARDDASLPLNQAYVDAFAAIERDRNQMLVMVEQAGTVIGCFQITFIPASRVAAPGVGRSNRFGWPAQSAAPASGRPCSNGPSPNAGAEVAIWSSSIPTRAGRTRTVSMNGSASRPATKG